MVEQGGKPCPGSKKESGQMQSSKSGRAKAGMK
jgi:hypothetical protein